MMKSTGKIIVILTAILVSIISGCSDKVLEKNEAYLFAYFIGNNPGQESIRFAVSEDGYNYKALNNNMPVLDNDTISSTGGVRDPHILRGADNKSFFMVATDLYVPEMGWKNYAMILLKSDDLINWESSKIDIPKLYPDKFGDVWRVWAPQTIYDEKAKKYMIYFSMKQGDDPDIIYYAYANSDFTALESAPQQLLFNPDNNACIDGDIVVKDDKFYLFHKSESGTPGIKLAISDNLTEGYRYLSMDRVDQETDNVEGSGVFKLNSSDEWILMYDVYGRGRYQFTKSKDLQNFTVIDEDISMNFHPRHGTVLPITKRELKRLTDKWGEVENNNPVLSGFYADPDVLYSNKTGKYYIYPTSDGFDNWSGDYFKTFSSDNLVDWKDEGVILDLKRDVSWADNNAWAPSIVEKKVDGKYKYFYYFTAQQKVGVAISDNPEGPFVDSGKPLIDWRPEGIEDGQEIDPDVFTDPQTGKSYLYWGNCYFAGAELNSDMTSIKRETLTLMNPGKTYREGAYVIYRKGIYYFMWSEDDTRSPNYKVRYATSTSPLGPLTIPENNIVIQKDLEKGILGTGHCSAIKANGTDQWYLVYHRFNYPDGEKMGAAAGFHREVCIDKLQFTKNGDIIEVKPTLRGVED